MSVAEVTRAVANRDLTAADAVHASLEAIARRDGDVAAFTALDPEGALLDAARASGPLAGVAVGVKDTFDTVRMPTTMGSALYEGWRPRADAALVVLARRAGASVVGKTASTPFAHADPAPTRNPRNSAHTPGGSSAGSAAAVAAGMVPLAVGSQTGGSVIRPASFCGVAALKPTFGTLPTAGLKQYAPSVDTPGLFAASVEDLTRAWLGLTGRQPITVRGPLRVGVTRQVFAGDADPEAERALAVAIARLEVRGVAVVDVEDPQIFARAWTQHPVLCDGEAFQALSWEWDNHRARLPPRLAAALEEAGRRPIEAIEAARQTAEDARAQATIYFAGLDAVMTYSAPGQAPEGLGSTGDARFNRLWSLLHVPCVNVPGYVGGGGLPVGVQIVSPRGSDLQALAIAALLDAGR